MWRAIPILVLFVLAGCPGDAQTVVDAAIDVSIDGVDVPATCTGACATTALTATFGGVTRTLDRAVYGITAEPLSVRVEAHAGGATGCPTETSPTPAYTMVLATVPVPPRTGSSRGNLLDFTGDLLGGQLGAAATVVDLTPVAASVCPECYGMPVPSDPDGFIALDIALTFNDGTVGGHLYAIHCDTLDAPN